MTETVYVPLLDEGVDVWRPAPARKVGDATYEILRPPDYDADDERWQFPLGSVVLCAPRRGADGDFLAAVRLHEPNRRTA